MFQKKLLRQGRPNATLREPQPNPEQSAGLLRSPSSRLPELRPPPPRLETALTIPELDTYFLALVKPLKHPYRTVGQGRQALLPIIA